MTRARLLKTSTTITFGKTERGRFCRVGDHGDRSCCRWSVVALLLMLTLSPVICAGCSGTEGVTQVHVIEQDVAGQVKITVASLKRCQEDADCPADNMDCLEVRGEKVCTQPCEVDEDCHLFLDGYCDQTTAVCHLSRGITSSVCSSTDFCNPGLECLSLGGDGY